MDLEGWFVFWGQEFKQKNYSGLAMSRHVVTIHHCPRCLTMLMRNWFWSGPQRRQRPTQSYKGWNSFFSLPNGLTCFFSSWDHLSSEVKILGVKNHRTQPRKTTSPRLNPHCIPTSQPTGRSVTELDCIFGIAQITPSWHVKGNWEGAPFSVDSLQGFFPVT